MVGAGCGITSVVFYTHGVFAVPIVEATGWQRGQVQLAFTLMSLMAIFTAPIVGWVIDRIGARTVAVYSVVTFGLGYALLSRSGDSLFGYYAAFMLMAILGAGTLPVTWTSVVNQWFHANRGLALGIALTGTGIAATLAPGYAGWLIARFGWQTAYFWLAVTVTAIALPLVLLLFRSPSIAAEEPDGGRVAAMAEGVDFGEALRGYRLWVLCVGVFLVAGSVAGLITSFVAQLTDRGFTLAAAAGYAGLIGVSVISGRLLAGLLVDRLWAPAVAAVLLACPAAAALALDGLALSPAIVSLCAVLIGLAAGAELDLMAFLSSRYFGLRRYASIYAVTFASFSVSAGLAPAAFGAVYDAVGSYSPVLRASAAACVIGALALLTLGPYPDFGGDSKGTDLVSPQNNNGR